MGWLTSHKTHVFTSAQRVITDDQLPDTLSASVIEAIYAERGIPDTILNNSLNSGTFKFEQMFAYGRDHYYYGLANTTLVMRNQGVGQVRALIEAEVGHPIELAYCQLLPPNLIHLAWQRLYAEYGYDPTSNQLDIPEAPIAERGYLDNLVAYYPQSSIDNAEPGHLIDLDTPATAGYTPERPANAGGIGTYQPRTSWLVGDREYVTVHYLFADVMGGLAQASLTLEMDQYDHEGDYYQAKYRYQDTQGVWHVGYWTYEQGSGVYPELDTLSGAPLSIDSCFPIVQFRDQKQDLTREELRETPAYLTSKELLRILGLDYQDISDSIHENPDIADIEQATLMMGIPINSTDQGDLRYLFEFFSRLEQHSPSGAKQVTQYSNEPVLPENTLLFEDASFKAALRFGGIQRRLRAGELGSDYARQISGYALSYMVVDPLSGTTSTFPVWIPTYTLRRRINAHSYEELVIDQPSMRYQVDWKYAHVAQPLELGEEGAEYSALIIPLDRSLLAHYTVEERERLYFRSLHFIFHSKIIQKIKWYESALFRVIVIAVAMYLTLISWGTTWQLLVAAAGIGLAAFAWTLLMIILEYAAYYYAFKLIVQELGLENSFIVALIAMAASAYFGGGSGVEGSPWASQLMHASSGLMQTIVSEAGELIENFNSETQEFNLMAEEAMNELEQLRRELDPAAWLNPLMFTRLEPAFVPGETPDLFFQRTQDSGNIGLLAIEAVDNYVELALTLPDSDPKLAGEFQ